MQKLIVSIFIFVISLTIFLVVTPNNAQAQCSCAQWTCDFVTNPVTGGTSQNCWCQTQSGACGTSCGPGYYASNNGCTPVGGSCSSNSQCNGGCCNGGTCGSCGGGVGGYVPRACGGGTTLKCGESPIGQNCVSGPSDGNRLCGPTPIRVVCRNNTQNCDNNFPSRFITRAQMAPLGTPAPRCGVGAFNSPTYNDYCQINCGCCTASQTYVDGVGCTNATPPPPPTPTCTVNVSNQSVTVGVPTLFPASVTIGSGTIDQVNFASSNTGVATVTTPDTVPSYSTTATGQSAGTSTITASVVMSGSVRCTDSAILTVTNTQAWWQVRDGDVTAETGDIRSDVPVAQLFNTNGTGGFPGVPVYAGSLSVTPGAISSTNWNADTTTSQGRIFDYGYFENLVPDNITPTTNSALLTSGGFVSDGYERKNVPKVAVGSSIYRNKPSGRWLVRYFR